MKKKLKKFSYLFSLLIYNVGWIMYDFLKKSSDIIFQ